VALLHPRKPALLETIAADRQRIAGLVLTNLVAEELVDRLQRVTIPCCDAHAPSMSRALSQLRKNGIIEIDGRRVRVLDAARLRRLATGPR
jgi:DNA-binding transcriptional ArsR family regulator